MGIWVRNIAFFLANLRICDLRTTTPKKLADLRLADLIVTSLRICDLRTSKKKCVPTFGFFQVGKNCQERLYYGRKTADSRCGWLGWLRRRLSISHSPSPG